MPDKYDDEPEAGAELLRQMEARRKEMVRAAAEIAKRKRLANIVQASLAEAAEEQRQHCDHLVNLLEAAGYQVASHHITAAGILIRLARRDSEKWWEKAFFAATGLNRDSLRELECGHQKVFIPHAAIRDIAFRISVRIAPPD